ncbi:hypothetical protein I3842_15G143200 [Carya illinoinensis]|uniref:Uncharacterized protein n=1 Tax=Carya illinoinensis TaxID=32201 RepID=A0A922A7C4_CARIL|nr:hypothetical protein I3842_15G143200 [Carya illinoinensis]
MPLSKTSKVDLRKQDEVPVDATLCKNNNIKAFCPGQCSHNPMITTLSSCFFLSSLITSVIYIFRQLLECLFF